MEQAQKLEPAEKKYPFEDSTLKKEEVKKTTDEIIKAVEDLEGGYSKKNSAEEWFRFLESCS